MTELSGNSRDQLVKTPSHSRVSLYTVYLKVLLIIVLRAIYQTKVLSLHTLKFAQRINLLRSPSD